MLVQTFSKVLLVVDYQANKEYIMEFLCINRDKPELHCEGHCYLQKQLQKEEQSNKHSDKQSQAQDYSINLYCQDLFQLKTYPSSDQISLNTRYITGPVRLAPLAIFHPPRFLA